MKKKYDLKDLEKDLKIGKVTVDYLDPLKSYMGVYLKGKKIANICVPGSVIPKMADFFLARIKKSKSQYVREECATELKSLVHYRWNNVPGFSD